ncbi:MAG: hypothetical protein HOE48_19680 [Candidatus Latescibacteria bacterium]|jgi:hypothetical protein|nr:hypothetical protein [Candidatus Latescibacterota bacterium]MBT4140148.1 hypothetical protein [Candidatus Latescibacterota bacterium]MBT5831664.1 hypothetical protein [Candidatus Latescibacterota bacterium]
MLPGFLTTALEIIIILDVCGVIAYFTITGIARMKDKKENTSPELSNTPPGMPALATEGAPMPIVNVPARITSTVYDPVTPEVLPPSPQKNQWTAGLKQRFTSMTRKFTYRPEPSGTAVKTQTIDADHAKLGRVLDSFKEET